MGLGYVANTGNGIMGVGFSQGEATLDKYPSVIEKMASENVIGSTAYSIWLNDLGKFRGRRYD